MANCTLLFKINLHDRSTFPLSQRFSILKWLKILSNRDFGHELITGGRAALPIACKE